MNKFKGGTVQVANDVIDVIIAMTALRVEEVVAVKGYDEQKNRLQRSYKNHLLTEVSDGHLRTDIIIKIDMNRPIIQIVEEVQEKIAEQVESMLGLVCDHVNVTVAAK